MFYNGIGVFMVMYSVNFYFKSLENSGGNGVNVF